MNVSPDSGTFVCYDIRGIQQHIFAVPNLKCIIGGSAQLDRFDRQTVPELAKRHGADRIFGGGGRGTLHGPTGTDVDALIRELVSEAYALGLDVRISQGDDLEVAVNGDQQLYAFVPDPESLEGPPCRMSGLWPVPDGTAGRGELAGVHPLIQERVRLGREDPFGQRLLEKLRDESRLSPPLQERFEHLRFMKNVNPDEQEDEAEEQDLARRGACALGSRNRWAIVAMDGNDMGDQHRAAKSALGGDRQRWTQWLKQMSQSLHDCTEQAVMTALGEVINSWWDTAGAAMHDADDEGPIILPFRPLLVGGDDILLLCHPSYAMRLAESIAERFEDLTRQEAEQAKPEFDLWPGTGNHLTISGGIVYTAVTFPLAAGIQYAESLQSSAKSIRERLRRDGEPTPAAIDWEQLTEKAIDTPQARRARELRFIDEDLPRSPEIWLTERPWRVEQINGRLRGIAARLAKIPRSVQHELLSGLRQPYWDRVRLLTRMRKQLPDDVFSLLWQDHKHPATEDGEGWRLFRKDAKGDPVITNPVPDAILLLQEEHRMHQETLS